MTGSITTNTPLTTPPPSKRKFTFYSASDFPDLPELEWRVDDVLPTSGLGSIFGPSGIGKSFLSLDLVAALATGRDWFGHATKQCRAVYVALEGQAGFRRRVAAWSKHNEQDFPESVDFVFDPIELHKLHDPFVLGREIEERGGAGVIVIDTLNRAAAGADENSSIDMGQIVAGATLLQKATSALVLLVHHPGKDITRSLRGHSSLYAAMDTIIELALDGELIQWKIAKSKDGEDQIRHAFSLHSVVVGENDNGKVLMSCVVEEAEGYSPSQAQNAPRGSNQRIILNAVKDLLPRLVLERRMQALVDNPSLETFDNVYVPATDVHMHIKDVLVSIAPKHRFSRAKEALDALVRQGYLVMQADGIRLPE